jgi:glycosyltransferase involved in cell wall biosynthesis
VRVLLAHSFYRTSGGEDRYVQQEAELLSKGHSVELLVGRNDRLSETPATAVQMVYSRKRRREAADTLARFDPDIVHVHNVYPSLGSAVHLAAVEARVPLVMTVHNFRMRCPNGLMFTEGSLCRRCQRGNYLQAIAHRCFPSRRQSFAYAGALWIHRFAVRLQDKVSLFVCPSDFVRKELVTWGVPAERTVTIPNFCYPQSNADPQPGSFGVFVGRLSSEKGVHVLLEALRIAKDPPFRVVGDGPMESALRNQAVGLGLTNTKFLGRLPSNQVGEVLRGSRFLVMPSLWNETGGLAALEAMAVARPVLVSSLGGLPELVREGTGLQCRPGDAVDLAKQIQRLMDDSDFCRAAGVRGLKVSRHEFGPEMHLARLETAFRTVLT